MLGNIKISQKLCRFSIISSLHPDSLQPLCYTTRSSRLSVWDRRLCVSYIAKPFDYWVSSNSLTLLKVNARAAANDQPKWWEKNAGPNMIDIHSTQEFLDALSQAGDRLVIVDFYGTWCASCRALFPKLCKIAEEHPEIIFLKVNFDENKSLCKSLNVKVLPYFHFYRGTDGLVDSFSCSLAKLQKFKDAIANHNKVPKSKSDGSEAPGDELSSSASRC